jgi:cell division protein FtsQ
MDLTDPDDVKVLANHRAGEVLVHLGSASYLERYKVYVTHVQEWQQQFDKLESVDLRYDRQIIVNPDLQGAAKQPPISSEAAKKAMAAGVKPAALITRMTTGPRPSPALMVKTVPPLVLKPTPARPIATRQDAKKSAAAKPVATNRIASRKAANAAHRKGHLRQTRMRAKPKARTTASATPKSGQKPSAPGLAGTAKLNPAKPSPAIARGEETQ